MSNLRVKFGSLFVVVLLLTLSFQNAKAAPCPTGGSQTISVSCEINGAAGYTDLIINGGAVITSGVGQKIDITATGSVTISAGSGIDVTGKGNLAAGAGSIGGTSGNACAGVFGGGGGGGGYGGEGGQGSTDVTALGGAGGGIHGSNTNPADLGSPGGLGGGNVTGSGMGGGAVKITAPTITLNGFIRANGTNGSDPRGNDGSGGGGGGSGGSIWLTASNGFNFAGGTLEAKGGAGGPDANCSGWDGPGGGGGGGRVSLIYKGPKIGAGTHTEAGGTGGGIGAINGAAGTFYEDMCYSVICNSPVGDCYSSPGVCNAGTGNCDYPPKAAGTTCNDSFFCTINDACDGAGSCLSGGAKTCDTPPGQCYNPLGTCNNATSSCDYTALADGTSCTDGNPCTLSDACTTGNCISGALKVCDTPLGDCYDASGTCNILTGDCDYSTEPDGTNCDDGSTCTVNDACNAAGSCVSGPNTCSGIVPCGRMVDNPATSWDESQPCNFCHLVLVFQLLIEFLVKLGSVAAVFGIAIGGLMHFFSVGDPGRMQGGRQAIRYSLLGFVVIFAAWAIIETILMSLGYIDPLGGKWFEVLCSLP